MEFDLRNVLIIIGFVVIAGILFDGYRRMRRSRMGEIGLPSEMGGSCEEDNTYYSGELPNGGARQAGDAAGNVQQRIEPGFGGAVDEPEAERYTEEYANDRFEVDSADSVVDQEPQFIEPEVAPTTDGQFGVVATKVNSFDDDGIGGVRRYSLGGSADDQVEPATSEKTQENDNQNDSQNVLFEDDDMLLSTRAAQEEKLASHYRGDENNAKAQRKSSKSPSKKARTKEPAIQDNQEDEIPLNVDGLEEVIVLNLMARSGEVFGGVELDKALTSCGFRFGEMNIYHRFEQHVGRGPLLFSLANVVEPGFFDLDNLDSFSTPGVCMFMKLPGPKRSMHSFELMVECGRKIVSLLDGELKDEHHCVMTQQTIEHYRQRVLDFDRKFLSQRVTQRS